MMLVKSLATYYRGELRASIVSAVTDQPRSSCSPVACPSMPISGCLEQEGKLVVTESAFPLLLPSLQLVGQAHAMIKPLLRLQFIPPIEGCLWAGAMLGAGKSPLQIAVLV